jgi:hypothetical protein
MTFDQDAITESKERYRRKLAALPFGEKLRILDRMRERDNALRRACRVNARALEEKAARPNSQPDPQGT